MAVVMAKTDSERMGREILPLWENVGGEPRGGKGDAFGQENQYPFKQYDLHRTCSGQEW